VDSVGSPAFFMAGAIPVADASLLNDGRETLGTGPRASSAMRIGIDGSCLSNQRGFGRFTRQLLAALSHHPTEHEFTVFVDRPSADAVSIPDRFERVIVAVREAPSRAARAHGSRRFLDMFAMGLAVARRGVDLMYFPATYSFFPVWNVRKLVVTMHDTLPLSHPELVFPGRKGQLAWRIKETTAVRLADRIVTVSHASRRDIAAWSGLPERRIHVITEGPDPIFWPRAIGPEARRVLGRFAISTDGRFFLYVGGLSPHKNLLRLVDAFARAAPSDVKLVLVGDMNDVFHTHVPQIRAAIARHELEERVILAGFVPDEDLAYLYSSAYALIVPSLLEGFGLPAVEAMACGTPVVSSRAGSLPEVVGEAGVYCEATDTQSIAGAIRMILDEPSHRDALGRLALARSALFTWDESARRLVACFDELRSRDAKHASTRIA
jgi:glycosyltransferase involved in cell wall biosynthesis